MRTGAVALIGTGAAVCALRAARRFAVIDRLPRRRPGARGLPGWLEARIARRLDDAAVDVSALHAVQCWGTAIIVAMILGFGVGGIVVAVGAACVAAAAGPAALWSARRRRARLATAAVPLTLEAVASELRAGGTIAIACARLARGDGSLAPDLARVHARVQLGATMSEALRAWAEERHVADVEVAAGALAMCAAIGGRAVDALEGVAASLRDRQAVAAEARAQSAQGRLSAIVVGGLPVVFVGWSALTDCRALHALVATAAGRACLIAGVGLELVGVWWMRRILRAGSLL